MELPSENEIKELNTLLKTFGLESRVYIFRISGGSYFYIGADQNMQFFTTYEELKDQVHEVIRKIGG